jgi:hypothetical protein
MILKFEGVPTCFSCNPPDFSIKKEKLFSEDLQNFRFKIILFVKRTGAQFEFQPEHRLSQGCLWHYSGSPGK